MAEVVNLQLQIGIDKRYDCTILNKAKTEAVEITGWALAWTIRLRDSLTAPVLVTRTTANGGIVITGLYDTSPTVNAQVARVVVSDDDTDLLAPGLYFHELRRTDAGFETPLLEGSLHLHE